MTPSVWFICPAHGRFALTAICLRQLRRTCDALTDAGVDATAVVVACDANLATARGLGFGTVRRSNRFLSQKFNDGIQAALDPRWNDRPASHVVPCGSDDWVDHRLFLDLPGPDTAVGFPRFSVVREDGREISTRVRGARGGCGVRIYPAALLAPLGYRPADEDRAFGCDMSIMVNVKRHWGDALRVEHRHLHDRQVVDWKSAGEQLNAYVAMNQDRRVATFDDPFEELAGVYPAEALDEMQAHYSRAGRRLVAA